MTSTLAAFLTGFSLSLSLILAIGAQNAFVLRQGLMRAHVLPVVLTCAVSDAVLITVGVAGFGWLVTGVPWLDPMMRWLGAVFLIGYGLRAAWSAWTGGGALRAANGQSASLRATVLTCLALTWLNPHVYLDTIVLLGSVAARWDEGRLIFGAGAVFGSFVFFFALGYGARLLTPLFAKPSAWRVLDAIIAVVMWAIAAGLILKA